MPQEGQTAAAACVPLEGVLRPPARLPKPPITWEEPQKPLVCNSERSSPRLPWFPVRAALNTLPAPTRARENLWSFQALVGLRDTVTLGAPLRSPPALGARVPVAPCHRRTGWDSPGR